MHTIHPNISDLQTVCVSYHIYPIRSPYLFLASKAVRREDSSSAGGPPRLAADVGFAQCHACLGQERAPSQFPPKNLWRRSYGTIAAALPAEMLTLQVSLPNFTAITVVVTFSTLLPSGQRELVVGVAAHLETLQVCKQHKWKAESDQSLSLSWVQLWTGPHACLTQRSGACLMESWMVLLEVAV